MTRVWTALLGSLFVASSFAQVPIPAPPQVGAVRRGDAVQKRLEIHGALDLLHEEETAPPHRGAQDDAADDVGHRNAEGR